ncbi:MAG: hypothetical protein M3082_21050 [Candidatus Dormibacteraeota bacterium]|nr:hypothetical protein [Candidatus Dormibacteraeota bacterium]
MVRHGIQQDSTLTAGLDIIVLAAGLLVPGWCLLSLLGLKSLSPALAVPSAIALGLAIPSVAAWLAWLSHTGMVGAAVITLLAAASVIVARIVLRKRVLPMERPGRLEVGAAIAALIALSLSLATGPWLGQSADSFYHMAAARELLRANQALPQEVFFRTQVTYPDATSGSLHLVLAWLSLLGGMVPAWVALSAFGAMFSALSFVAFAREVTRSTAAALMAVFLYFLLELNLDMRDSGYPDRIGIDVAWLSIAFLLRFARSNGSERRELIPLCLLGFTAGSIYSGMAPLLVVMVAVTFVAAAVVALRGRRLRSLRPLAIACIALMLVVLPVLAIRVLAVVPAPGFEASLATHAPPLKVQILHGYPFVDFRFWFSGFVTVTTLATVSLLGRARRLLLQGDAGAALLWGGVLFVPVVAVTPLLTGWPTGLYFFARIAFNLGPLLLVTLGGELSALLERVAALNVRPAGLRVPASLVVGVLLVCGILYVIAGQVPVGAQALYFGNGPRSINTSRHNDLTQLWSDRLRALDAAGPGTILAGHETSYELAGLTGRGIVAVPFGHGSYQDEARDGALRRGDVADALNPSADSTALLSVLFRYRVTFVLIDRGRDGQATWDWIDGQKTLTAIAEGGDWKLFRFDSNRLDQALDIPLAGGVGMLPTRVIAGRAVLVRITSPGESETAQVTAKGLTSGASYTAQFELPDPSGTTITAPLVMPDTLPVDRYAVTVSISGGPPLTAGQVEVGHAYEAEFFAGVVADLRHGFVRQPAWEAVDNPAYNRGEAAVALRAGKVANHPFIDPPGDYCLSITVFDTGDGSNHVLNVGLGGTVVGVNWSDTAPGIRDLDMLVHSGSESRQLSYWVAGGGPVGVIVDRITLYPPASGTCRSAPP